MGRNTHGREYTHTHELNTTIIMNVYTMCIKKLSEFTMEITLAILSINKCLIYSLLSIPAWWIYRDKQEPDKDSRIDSRQVMRVLHSLAIARPHTVVSRSHCMIPLFFFYIGSGKRLYSHRCHSCFLTLSVQFVPMHM